MISISFLWGVKSSAKYRRFAKFITVKNKSQDGGHSYTNTADYYTAKRPRRPLPCLRCNNDLIRKHVADQPFAKLCLRAKDIIRKHGGIISRTELARAMRLRPRDLDEVVQALLTEESIELAVDTAVTKPRVLYKLI
jgi:hypothetical protein